MTQLVLTNHTGQNLRYPVSKLAKFIIQQKQNIGKASKAIEQDLLAIMQPHQLPGGFVLLNLDSEAQLNGLLVMQPGTSTVPATIEYLVPGAEREAEIRLELIRNALKISQGSIQVGPDLTDQEISWLRKEGYAYHAADQRIQRP